MTIDEQILHDINYVYFPEEERFLLPLDVSETRYAGLVRHLLAEVTATDDTDFNCDVCYSYLIESKQGWWWLRLSQIGPYALLIRPCPDGRAGGGTVVEGTDDDVAQRVLPLLSQEAVRLLGRDLLETELPFVMPDFDGPSTVYGALFEDAEEFPWRS